MKREVRMPNGAKDSGQYTQSDTLEAFRSRMEKRRREIQGDSPKTKFLGRIN